MKPLLELKNWPKFCPVNLSLTMATNRSYPRVMRLKKRFADIFFAILDNKSSVNNLPHRSDLLSLRILNKAYFEQGILTEEDGSVRFAYLYELISVAFCTETESYKTTYFEEEVNRTALSELSPAVRVPHFELRLDELTRVARLSNGQKFLQLHSKIIIFHPYPQLLNLDERAYH
jgi:hypothetical protein